MVRWAVAVCLLVLVGGRVWGAQARFYASFDQSIEPEKTAGKGGARPSDPAPRLMPGIVGQAVVVGAQREVSYDIGENLRPDQGSIAFLARPIGWNGDDGVFHFFVRARAESGDWVFVYKVPENKLQFMGGTAKSYSFAEAPAEGWTDGQWKYICVTWVGQEGWLYVDGALAGKGHWPVLAKSFGNEFTLGGTVFGASSAEQAIDELTIYDDALPAEQVAENFEKYKPAMEKANAQVDQKKAAASDEQRRLLAASFDGKIEADFAAGSKKATASGKAAFTAGLSGKAVLVGRQNAIDFPLSGNLNSAAGTMSFWAKPVGWSGDDGQWHYFVTIAGEDDWMLLQTVNNSLSFLGGTRKAYGETTTPIGDWRQGVWKFVTLTWDNGRNRIYLDGKPASEVLSWPRVPMKVGEVIRLGGQLHGESGGQIALEDLEIRDVSLPADQVEALYQAKIAKIPSIRDKQEFLRRQQVIDPNNIATAAYGAIVLPSSQSDSSAQEVEKLCDGNFDTRWMSAAGTFANWVEVRWPQPVMINKILINESPIHKTSQYRVDAYVDGKWTSIVPARANARQAGEQIVETFAPVEAWRIRYIMLAPEGDPKTACSSIAELQACSAQPMPDLSKIARSGWKSNWIWYPEPIPSDVARYFRKLFQVEDPAAVRRAVLQIGADDAYEVYLNGQRIGNGGIPTDRYEVGKFLIPGDNVIAVKVHQYSGFAGLICELAMVREDSTVRIVSDGSWKSLKEEAPDWKQPNADESAWKPCLEQGVPPNCPDHQDQAYYDAGGKDHFELVSVSTSPGDARPGQSVEVNVQLTAPRAVGHDYAFTLRIGERKVSLFADFTVAARTFLPDTPTSQWKAGEKYTLKTKIVLPDWAPNGAIPLFLSSVGPDAQTSVEKAEDGAIGQVKIRKFEADPKPWPAETPRVEVRQSESGHPTLVVNGEILPPQILTENSYASYEAFGEQAKTGIHLWRIYAARGRDSKFYPEDKKRERAELCEVFDKHIEFLLKEDPEAYIIVGTTFNVSQEWTDQYPDDATVMGDGRRVQHSFSSRRWINEMKGDIDVLVKHLMNQPYSGHVIGFHFGIGAGPETYYWGLNANAYGTPREKLILGDFSPEHIAAFRQWLRRRYGEDVKALQAAWKDQNVTFDNAKPDQEVLRREDLFMFRDPAKTRMPMDYWEFHADVMAQRVIDIGSAIKQASGGKYITGFWGLYSNGINALTNLPGHLHQCAYAGLQKVLDSDAVDYVAMLQEYLNVRWGTPMAPDNVTGSIRRHGKMALIEYDMRTFFTPIQFTERTFSQPETLSVMQRDVAAAAVRGDAFWWVAFPQGTTGRLSVPWYAEESIIQKLIEGRKVFDACYRQEYQPASQVAVFINNADVYDLDVMLGAQLLASTQYNTWANELTKVGAPFDQYLLDDVALPGMDQYKVYIFLNAFNVSQKQREAIHKLLDRSGKTAVWLYGSGFSDGKSLSAENIEELTGFQVAVEDRKALPEARIEPGHAYTAGVEKDHLIRPRPYQHHAGPFEIGPIFDVVDPAAEVLGRYTDNQKAAYAHKKIRGYESVYMAIPYLDASVARGICRAAGVHLYAEEDVYLDATGRFLTITATSAGCRLPIKLPRRSCVYDVFGGKVAAQNAVAFQAEVAPLTTALYFIGSEAEMSQFAENLSTR